MNKKKVLVLVVAGAAAVLVMNKASDMLAGEPPQNKPAVVTPVQPVKPAPAPAKEVIELEKEPEPTPAELAKIAREEELKRRKLRLRQDDFLRVRNADYATILQVNFLKGASGDYIAQVQPLFTGIQIESDGQMGSHLVFTTEHDKESAARAIEGSAIVSTGLKDEAVRRRLTCGVNKCIGSAEAFPELAARFLPKPENGGAQ